jgi:hypothetical protein
VVVLVLSTKSWIESGYVRDERRSQAVFLQMPLVVFKRARDVGVVKDIENPIIRENVVACEFVVGRDVVFARSMKARFSLPSDQPR